VPVPPLLTDSSSPFLLAAIVDSSDDAIISKSLDGIIRSWNRSAQRMFGWTADEAVGQPITIIVPSEMFDEEIEILKRLRAGEQIVHLETVRKKKSGEQIGVSLTISPIRDSMGMVVGASKIARDITERKNAEAKLKVAYDHLEERVQERTAELWENNKQLMKQAETVRELSGHLLQSQDEERRRIARELHDSVGQLLAAVSMTVAKVSNAKHELNPEVNKNVREIADLVEQALKEIRTVSHLLHPPLLDEVGLEFGLRDFITGFAQRSKIEVSFIVSPAFERLSQDYEIAIFRVVQECLTNIHRHSGSKTAKIQLLRKDGRVRCEVSDQGRGMPDGQKLAINPSTKMGVGLRGMRERVSQLGGILEVHSSGKGTMVAVELPVTRSVEELAREASI
jgi:PAS domain S-box-containing protein